MAEPSLLQQAIDVASSVASVVPDNHTDEMRLLLKDLGEATATLFVKTAEAKPMIERCFKAAEAIKAAVGGQGWNDAAETAFGDFERAVSKLRNTILVRTQRAT